MNLNFEKNVLKNNIAIAIGKLQFSDDIFLPSSPCCRAKPAQSGAIVGTASVLYGALAYYSVLEITVPLIFVFCILHIF